MKPNNKTTNANEHTWYVHCKCNMVKNPNWQEADQLAIYKHQGRVELWSTEKQLYVEIQFF